MSLSPGNWIGGYEIVALIGEGPSTAHGVTW
jgi:hypothetical protein